jgi:hypothetical protein
MSGRKSQHMLTVPYTNEARVNKVNHPKSKENKKQNDNHKLVTLSSMFYRLIHLATVPQVNPPTSLDIPVPRARIPAAPM